VTRALPTYAWTGAIAALGVGWVVLSGDSSGPAPVDTSALIIWLSVTVKALACAAMLSAIGSVLVLATLREISERGRASLRLTAAVSALAI